MKRFLSCVLALSLGLSSGLPTFAAAPAIPPSAPYINHTARDRLCSSHSGAFYNSGALTNGTTQLSGTERIGFTVNTTVTGLQFLFSNGPPAFGGTNTPVGNPIKIFAGLETDGNAYYPIQFGPWSLDATFASGVSATIADGGMVLSQPIPSYVGTGPFVPGTTYYYRTYKAVSAGQKWFNNHAQGDYGYKTTYSTDFVNGGATNTGADVTWPRTATQGTALPGAATYYGAVAVIGEQVIPAPVTLITGTSIAAGAGSISGQGWAGLALDNALLAYTNAGVGGASLLGTLTQDDNFSSLLSRYADYLILANPATNDLNGGTTLATEQTNLQYFISNIGTANLHVWLTTETPRTTGSWATYAGQTPFAAEAVRVAWNNWIRDKTATGAVAMLNAQSHGKYIVLGYIDDALQVERNSDGSAVVLDSNGQQTGGGYWFINGGTALTGDGIHPNTTGIGLISPVVSPIVTSAMFPLY
jgi:hypothetical protein